MTAAISAIAYCNKQFPVSAPPSYNRTGVVFEVDNMDPGTSRAVEADETIAADLSRHDNGSSTRRNQWNFPERSVRSSNFFHHDRPYEGDSEPTVENSSPQEEDTTRPPPAAGAAALLLPDTIESSRYIAPQLFQPGVARLEQQQQQHHYFSPRDDCSALRRTSLVQGGGGVPAPGALTAVEVSRLLGQHHHDQHISVREARIAQEQGRSMVLPATSMVGALADSAGPTAVLLGGGASVSNNALSTLLHRNALHPADPLFQFSVTDRPAFTHAPCVSYASSPQQIYYQEPLFLSAPAPAVAAAMLPPHHPAYSSTSTTATSGVATLGSQSYNSSPAILSGLNSVVYNGGPLSTSNGRTGTTQDYVSPFLLGAGQPAVQAAPAGASLVPPHPSSPSVLPAPAGAKYTTSSTTNDPHPPVASSYPPSSPPPGPREHKRKLIGGSLLPAGRGRKPVIRRTIKKNSDRRFRKNKFADHLHQVSLVASARSQDEEAKKHCILTGRKPVLLDLDCDDESLSEYQCLVRQQIEMFEANEDDLNWNAQTMNKAVVLGQVGIRCRHCAVRCQWERTRGSVYYAASLDGVYQAAQNMSKNHLCSSCKVIPEDLKKDILKLKDSKRRATGGKQYWAEAARALGVFEDKYGLRFKAAAEEDRKEQQV